MIKIPYGKQTIDDDDINAVIEVLKSDYLTTGPKIEKFEEDIKNITGAKYALAVSSGTAALHLASLSLLEKNDYVITTPNSFVATANAILYAKSHPIFIDINEDGNIDLDKAEQLIKTNKKIKALYVVHFSGNMVDQKKLKYIKEHHNIKILEDCAHSLGASFPISNDNIINAGSCAFSDCSIFSFHPVKHITTAEGGAITTNDRKIHEKIIKLRNHGITKNKQSFLNKKMAYTNDTLNPWYYEMQELGYNYRMSDLQAALGISQLKKLKYFLEKRKEIAYNYEKAFASNELINPLYNFNEQSAYHLYVIKINFNKLKLTKAKLMNKLIQYGIHTQVHYIPINKQPLYRKYNYGNENTPAMDSYYNQCLSLPIYPSLTFNNQEYIINTLTSSFR